MTLWQMAVYFAAEIVTVATMMCLSYILKAAMAKISRHKSLGSPSAMGFVTAVSVRGRKWESLGPWEA